MIRALIPNYSHSHLLAKIIFKVFTCDINRRKPKRLRSHTVCGVPFTVCTFVSPRYFLSTATAWTFTVRASAKLHVSTCYRSGFLSSTSICHHIVRRTFSTDIGCRTLLGKVINLVLYSTYIISNSRTINGFYTYA